ncbi:uncharacterized protein LOC118277150 [Spodoptera frugiperda]|uniref:Uncharacterized protein LOC118277150 n=1 Tax=Spodoptera frugiperda TaxID=7108 RepID=A0A9R0EQZ5_SPOFR|nr:uncharacterized protein LOC118277150 [Spodoptera frugiperda]
MKIFVVVVLLAVGVTSKRREPTAVTEYNELDARDLPKVTELDLPNDEMIEEDDDSSRNNLVLGSVGPNDRQMTRIVHNVAAADLLIHEHEVTFRGARGTNITAVSVNQVGANSPVAQVLGGGLGSEFVTIGIKSVRGRGFSYTMLVHAEINCSNN